MKLSDLEEVTRLRNWRKRAFELINAADSAIELKFLYYKEVEPFSVIGADCVREAIKNECQRCIAAWNDQLRELGVEIDP